MTIGDGAPAKSDASKVRAYGKGLSSPAMGPDNEFNVIADEAGEFFQNLTLKLQCANLKPNQKVIDKSSINKFFRQKCSYGWYHRTEIAL